MSNFSENLLKGFQVGYGVSSDISARHKQQQRETDIGNVFTSGPGHELATADDYHLLRNNMMQTYAKYGDPVSGAKIDEYLGGQMKGKLNDGLTQIRALADTGTPEAMQQATALIPKVYSFLPNGQTVHTVYNPQDQSIYVTPIDEKTGLPVSGSKGAAYNAANLKKQADDYLQTVSELKANELAQAKLEEEQRHAGVEESQGQQRIGVEKQQVGVAQQQVQATREANQASIAERQAELKQRQQEEINRQSSGIADRTQKQKEFDATLDLNNRQLASGDISRKAGAMQSIAAADKMYADMARGSSWTPTIEQSGQRLVDTAVKAEQSSQVLGEGPPIDTAGMARDAWDIMRANQPGEVIAGEAIATIKGVKADTDHSKYTVQQPQPGSASANQGLVMITDKATGRSLLVPQTTVLRLLGPGARPVGVSAPPPPGAGPPGSGGD